MSPAPRLDYSDPKAIQRVQERARHVAIRKGYPELADDFAQEIFVQWLSGRGRHQTIDQTFIDYLRAQYGRTGLRGGRGGKPRPKDFINIDELRDLAEPPRDIEPDRGFAHLFRGREAFLYHARFVEEMSEAAIGDILGLTESRVCQMLGPIKRAIQDAAILADARERMEWDEDFGKIAVEWITI